MTEDPERGTPATYRDAGVDIDQATRSLGRIAGFARSTWDATQSGAIGHFGGVYRLGAGPERLLVASADGIGTKIKLAFLFGGGAHARVGADLVNHCVNDLLACGARPLFFLDYIAMGSIDTATLEGLVEGMAAACHASGVALIGGETAEMPGLYAPGEYDAAGFITGEVAPDRFIDGSTIEAGDRLVGLPALGLHTNGYSLARFVLGLSGEIEHDLEILAATLPNGSGESIGDAMMAPHPSYLTVLMPLIERDLIRGVAHITGGGILDNVPRMLPGGLAAVIAKGAWTPNPIFPFLIDRGRIDQQERYRAFNMGIGMIVAVRQSDLATVLDAMPGAIEVGTVRDMADQRVVIKGGTL